jgi:hypothetical protein
MSTHRPPPSVAGVASKLNRRLRLALSRQPVAAEDSSLPPATPHRPQVEFMAYAEDCILSGFVRLDADRLSDLLNAHDEYELVDVCAMDLRTGVLRETPAILVDRDELMLVHATGPRGVAGRRVRTRQHPVALGVGPYAIRGYLHSPPGADPIASFRRRRPMVALTDAWVEYHSDGVPQRRRVSSVVVNRTMVDWIVEVVDDIVEMPDIPVQVHGGVQAKDLTGHVRGSLAG